MCKDRLSPSQCLHPLHVGGELLLHHGVCLGGIVVDGNWWHWQRMSLVSLSEVVLFQRASCWALSVESLSASSINILSASDKRSVFLWRRSGNSLTNLSSSSTPQPQSLFSFSDAGTPPVVSSRAAGRFTEFNISFSMLVPSFILFNSFPTISCFLTS